MSSIPTSAMPRAVAPESDERSSERRGVIARIVRIATAPAIVTLGLTAMAVTAVAEVLAAKGSPVTAPDDQVPI
jgi:tRNA(Met) C34 N-acetyltransferase TmcA